MSQIHKVLYDFEAEEEGEMTVRAGDIVKVLPQSEGPDGDEDDRNGWVFVKATRTGQRGYVPLDYIEPTQTPVAMKSPAPPASSSNNNTSTPGLGSVQESTPNRLPFTTQSPMPPQTHNQDQNHTPDVGMRLSLSSLVNAQRTEPKVDQQIPVQTQQQPTQTETVPEPKFEMQTTAPPPPPPMSLDSESLDSKPFSMDKKPFGMDVENIFPSPGKRSGGKSGNSLARSMQSPSKSGAGSKAGSKFSGLSKFKKSANMVQNMVRVSSAVAAPRVPSLASAVDREDWDELTKRNDEYFARLVSSQAETFDSLTDMVDALSKKLNEATKSSSDLVSKLAELDELIDEEKRKWKSQNEAEKNAEVLGRSRQLIASSDGSGTGGLSDTSRLSPRGQ